MNPMRNPYISKVTLNIGVGQTGEKLDNAKLLLERLTGMKPVETKARERNPVFKLRVGLPIGAKVTLRGKKAEEFLRRVFASMKNKVKLSSIDNRGNISIGVKQYIDLPGIKYDPRIGVMGLDVCVTIERKGARVAHRRFNRAKLGKAQAITKEETAAFLQEKFGVTVA